MYDAGSQSLRSTANEEKEVSKSTGDRATIIAYCLLLVAGGAYAASRASVMLASYSPASDPDDAQETPVDEEAVAEIIRSISPDVEFIASDHKSDPWPAYTEMMEEDAPNVFISFDLATGIPGPPCTLAEASRIIMEELGGSMDTISRELFSGQCVECGGKGYVRQVDYPAYHYAHYRATIPQP